VIVRALRFDAIADRGQLYGGRAFNDGLREATLHHVPVHVARCGDRWATDDGVTLSVLSPCGARFSDRTNDVNENSVVVMLTYRCPACARPFRMLFTGDAGAQTEARMLASGADLAADVRRSDRSEGWPSRVNLFIRAQLRGRGPSEIRPHQRRPAQSVRPPGTNDACDASQRWSDDVPH
jgi:hypothetical protein